MSARFATIETLERRQLFAGGDLDPTFGTGGSIPYSAVDPAITVLTPLAGGKFLSIGPEGAFRRNADATVDSTFHSGPTLDHILDVEVLSDGKILISGSDDQAQTTLGKLLRLNADGTRDTTFGTNGIVLLPNQLADGITVAQSIDVQPDGKIVAAGTLGSIPSVYRLTAAGDALDGTFATFHFDAHPIDQAATLRPQARLQSSGKIIVGGWGTTLARLNANGTLDTSFGTSGFVEQVQSEDFLVQGDDTILAAGNDGAGIIAVTKLSADGVPDMSFGNFSGDGPHHEQIDFGFTQGVVRIKLAPANKIVVSSQIDMARLNSDGSLDNTFGRLVTIDQDRFAPERSDLPRIRMADTVVQPDGSIFVLADAGFLEGRLYRLQGSSGGPDGPITMSGSVVTVTGTSSRDQIDVFVNFDEDTESGPLVVRMSDNFGRVFDRADVSQVNVNAGAGDDWVVARAGISIHTSVSGGDGNDTLLSGPGGDSLFGDAGRDVIEGHEGGDLLDGGTGRDHISGGDGDDTIRGGASGDFLAGQAGDDVLLGQGGADRLDGGDGADTISGNAGNDFINASPDSAVDHLFGDGGTDTMQFDDSADLFAGIEFAMSTMPT